MPKNLVRKKYDSRFSNFSGLLSYARFTGYHNIITVHLRENPPL